MDNTSTKHFLSSALGLTSFFAGGFDISKNDEVSTILDKKWWFLSTILDKKLLFLSTILDRRRS